MNVNAQRVASLVQRSGNAKAGKVDELHVGDEDLLIAPITATARIGRKVELEEIMSRCG